MGPDLAEFGGKKKKSLDLMGPPYFSPFPELPPTFTGDACESPRKVLCAELCG